VFCRQRLSEGTSAALVQVGFQPVTDPLLEQLALRLLFSDGTPVHMIDILVYLKSPDPVKMQCDFLTKMKSRFPCRNPLSNPAFWAIINCL
jgi:hypothetical protein